MRREDVYIANVIKCRPPGNRDPEREEIAQCSSYLTEQIEAVDPLVIVPLGRHALGWFNPSLRITASNGKIFQHEGRVIMPLLHPSSGLRNPSHAQMLREGIHNIRDALLEGIRARQDISAVDNDGQSDTEANDHPQLERHPMQSPINDTDKNASNLTQAPAEEVPVALFERSQSQEEATADMRRLRAIEEAEESAEREPEKVVVDDRQSSLF
jgi:hypothetical protein